jgi:hypothetical protein
MLALTASSHAVASVRLEAFEGPVARFLFQETREGSRILNGMTLGARGAERDFQAFLGRLSLSEASTARDELAQVARDARSAVAELRGVPDGEVRLSQTALSAEERALVEVIAFQRLRLNPAFPLETTGNGAIRFLPETPGAAPNLRQRFLEPASVQDPASHLRPEFATGPQKARGLKWARDRFRSYEQCLRSRPSGEATRRDLTYALESLAIAEGMTLFGYVSAAGSQDIQWKDLPTDLIMTAFSSFTGSRFLGGSTTFRMRWLKVTAFGEARAGIDATVYYLSPLNASTPSPERFDSAMDRAGFNAKWSATTSVIPVTVYTLFEGMKCLDPTSALSINRISRVARLGISAGTSWAYFTLRRSSIGQ